MADETTQADAAALVAMTVADLAGHLDGVDLATLQAAKELEQAAPSPRKGALAALEAAIEGHPELAQTAAENAEADATESPAPDAPAEDAETAPEDVAPESGDEAVLSGPEAPWAATHFLMSHPDGGTSDAFATDEATGALLVPIGREGELFPHGFVVIGEIKIEA